MVCVFIIHTHTGEYYSAIKRNNIILFAVTWMQLEILMLCKLERKRQIPYAITYMWNLKHGTNEPIYETKTDSGTWKTHLWLPRERHWEGVR